jgi:hypothetical protein
LRESLEVTKLNKELIAAEHARGVFKLSEALYQDSTNPTSEAEAEDLRGEAETLLKKMDSRAVSFGAEKDYDRLIPIYWR